MPSEQQPTYFDKIQNRFKNNPIIAWLILAVTVILTLGALVPAIRSLMSEILVAENEPALNITLAAYDPRFGEYEAGRRMNWGGGSEMLFIETAEPIDLPFVPVGEYGYDYGVADFTSSLMESFDVEVATRRIWEVIPHSDGKDGMRIRVHAVYDAGIGEPTCVILEWGLVVEDASLPTNGLFLTYKLAGGANTPPIGGEVQIGRNAGSYPVTLWLDESENRWDSERNEYVEFGYGVGDSERPTAKPEELVQYLKPSEPVILDINVTVPGESPSIHDPRPTTAKRLRVYARVLVKGSEWLIESSNSVQAVTLSGSNDWQVASDHIIENLRPNAYLDDGELVQEVLSNTSVSSALDSKTDSNVQSAVEGPTTSIIETQPEPSGSFAIQLASITSANSVQPAWEAMQRQHPELLGSLALSVQEAEVQGELYYRIQAGSFADRGEAQDICAQLNAAKQDCLVVRR